LLKLARLPSVIVSAFARPTEICEGWGGELADALDDTRKRGQLIRVARQIAVTESRPPAREVYRQLIASTAEGRRPRFRGHDEVVTADDGSSLFRIRRQLNSIALILPIDKVSARTLENVRNAVASILEKTVSSDSNGVVVSMRTHERAPEMALRSEIRT
jgi:hypothetical protein